MAGKRANGKRAKGMGAKDKNAEDKSAMVVPYKPNLKVVVYVMKMMNEPDGDWNFKNLDHFLPSLQQGMEASTARDRRRRRRFIERAIQLKSAFVR
jgi:hypothetical protein